MSRALFANGTVAGDMSCFIIDLSDGHIFNASHVAFAEDTLASEAAVGLSEVGNSGRFQKAFPSTILTISAGKTILVQYMEVAFGSVAYTDTVIKEEILYVNSAGTDLIDVTSHARETVFHLEETR